MQPPPASVNLNKPPNFIHPEFAPQPSEPPKKRRRWSEHALVVAAILVFGIFDITFAMISKGIYNENARDPRAASVITDYGAVIFGLWLITLVFAAIMWKKRPWLVYGVVIGMAVIGQVGLTLVCIMLTVILSRRQDRNVYPWLALSLVVGFYIIIQDARETVGFNVLSVLFSGNKPGDVPLDVPPYVSVIVGTLLLALSVVLGFGMRSATAAKRSAERAHKATDRVTGLEQQVARQGEHELLAREVHDGVSSKLSRMALIIMDLRHKIQGADLPNQTAVDATLATADTTIKEAHKELSDLISLLREPGALAQRAAESQRTATAGHRGLTAITRLVDEMQGAGAMVSSNISIESADTISSTLGSAAYRIVQESITNATKHARGQHAWVTVEAAPHLGIHLKITNDLATHGQPHQVPSGRGLIGIQERVQILGGTCTIGVNAEGRFAVEATLPWAANE